jgi:hypothetical protein
MYFCGVKLQTETGHDAHYYGPFSENVEHALALNVIAGDLDETTETIPDWYGGPDALKYTYTLTPAGQDLADQLKTQYPAEAETVRETISAIKTALPDLRQRTLSAAAKVHLIVSREPTPVSFERLSSLADGFGWKLQTRDIENTRSILDDLQLVEFS